MERQARWLGRALGIGVFLILAIMTWVLRPWGLPLWALLMGAALVSWGLERLSTRKARRREKLRGAAFPAEWEAILLENVVFYQVLEPAERVRFQKEVQVFLGEKRVTGIGTEVDDTVRVLTAASAVIPIFGFPDWEWEQINEVLIYPNRFTEDYEFSKGDGRHTLGMVGTGAMNRLMILAKPDLLAGFKNSRDQRNVGLHEFAHLVDKTDGAVDGIPEVGLDRRSIGPWVELVRREMQALEDGDSDLDPYGLTNEAEFFAVATEAFFERPERMRERHPDLYRMLSKIFRQDLARRAREMMEASALQSRGFVSPVRRNGPCPCGSGEKFKKCCRRKSRPFRP